jgi:hypothetical protein
MTVLRKQKGKTVQFEKPTMHLSFLNINNREKEKCKDSKKEMGETAHFDHVSLHVHDTPLSFTVALPSLLPMAHIIA